MDAIVSISDAGVKVKPVFGRASFVEPWENISEIDVEGPEQIGSRITATRLLTTGVFAFALKKKDKSSAFILVRGTFGEFVFEAHKKAAGQLRGPIAAWKPLMRGRVQLPEVTSQSGGEGNDEDRLAQLEKLADLRDRGVLTDEEFANEKARIIGE